MKSQTVLSWQITAITINFTAKLIYRVQQQIGGEVVDFNLAFFQFIWECNSENIIKIGPYLPKLLQKKFGAVFLAHPVEVAN